MNSFGKTNDTNDRRNDKTGDVEATVLMEDVRRMCNRMSNQNRNAAELNRLLKNPHMNALAEAHDNIACKAYDEPGFVDDSYEMEVFGDDSGELPTNAIRVVGIRKLDGEPLGMTVKVDDGCIVIARIIAGGLIDRQGLLHVGDVILEVNGQEVTTPEQLQEHLKRSKGSVTFKVSPSTQDTVQHEKCYMRALFNYDPSFDTLMPCKELGLAFKQGEILEILNQEDPNWWQAKKAEYHVGAHAGLVPSQELEERRKAFVPPELDHATRTSICGTKITRKKKKEMYQIHANSEFDKAELLLYEEVCRTVNFERKCIVFIGAQGVGKRSLKNRLVACDPDRYSSPLPHTSRPIREGEQDGKAYHFVRRDIMEQEIADGKYLEWGEFSEHLYGTKMDSIREIMSEGRTCLIDCNPQCLKTLKTSEFSPYVMFIGAPPLDQLRYMNDWGKNNLGQKSQNYNYYATFDRALNRQNSRRLRSLRSLQSFYEDEDLQITVEESARIHRVYEKYYDLVLINNNFEKTFEQMRDAIDALYTEPQWVPIAWVNSAS